MLLAPNLPLSPVLVPKDPMARVTLGVLVFQVLSLHLFPELVLELNRQVFLALDLMPPVVPVVPVALGIPMNLGALVFLALRLQVSLV